MQSLLCCCFCYTVMEAFLSSWSCFSYYTLYILGKIPLYFTGQLYGLWAHCFKKNPNWWEIAPSITVRWSKLSSTFPKSKPLLTWGCFGCWLIQECNKSTGWTPITSLLHKNFFDPQTPHKMSPAWALPYRQLPSGGLLCAVCDSVLYMFFMNK